MKITAGKGRGISKSEINISVAGDSDGGRRSEKTERVALQVQLKYLASCGNHTLCSREKWIKILQENKISGTKEASPDYGGQWENRTAVFHASLCCHFSNTWVVERKSHCEDLLPLQWALGDLSQIWNLSGLKLHRAGRQKWQKSKGPTGKGEH